MDTLTRMKSFVAVVDAGGFSAAGRTIGRSKALLSKYVRELEDELGARLLNRTTRQLSLTEAGEAYYRESTEILQRVEDLNASVGETNSAPRGRLRVSAPRSFGDGPLGDAIMAFVAKEPDIVLDLSLDDRFVDLVEEGFDIAIRISEMSDSSLIARRLGPFRVICCATPEFLAEHGRPATPSDLTSFPCIIDTNFKGRHNWPFQIDGGRSIVTVKGRVEANSPLATRAAAFAGLGVARVPILNVQEDLAAGRLETVLDEFETDSLGVYILYPHRRHLAGKVRAFVDFLAGRFSSGI